MGKGLQIESVVRAGMRISAAICGVMFLSLTGCIKENTDGCPERALLYVVVEREAGDAGAALNGATVFLFNSDRTYLNSIEVSPEDIAGNVGIPIEYSRDNLLWAVVWGNLGSGESVSPLLPGTGMESLFITMNRAADGYAVAADDLFFGAKQLSGEPVEEVAISRKTGRISITVTEFPPDDGSTQYFLYIETPYDSYDFTGNPLPGTAVLRIQGVYSGEDLVTPEPVRMFHFPSSGAEDQHLTVTLYRRSPGSDQEELLAIARTDIEGRPIVIMQGMTTNVLITLTGDIGIRVIITDWQDTIDQWDDW